MTYTPRTLKICEPVMPEWDEADKHDEALIERIKVSRETERAEYHRLDFGKLD